MTKPNALLSYGLVFVQLVCLGLIALTGPLFATNPVLLLLEGAAGFLGLWAIWTMGIGNFNVTPDVKHRARLVTTGPYRYIRHPMYSALLLGGLTLVLDYLSTFRLAIWLLLVIVLLFKLSYEEKLLTQTLGGYAAHMRQTKRLIPFVY